MTNFGVCEHCGKPVTSLAGHVPAYPVTGWEVHREAGGTNHVRCRERVPNRVRHEHCLPDQPGGQNQESLL